MTKQEKQIPNLIKDKDHLKKIFNERIKDIDPKAAKVLRFDSYFIKEHNSRNFFHFVLYNNLTLKTVNGLRKRVTVLCISFSGHGRKKMYQTLKLVYQNGFSKGSVIVPRPLWYIDELMAAFYIGVPGDNLLEHIKNGYLNLTTIRKIASGLSALHDISPKSLRLSKHKFSAAYLDPTNVINFSYNKGSHLTDEALEHFKKLKKLVKSLVSQDEYLLSHGDFHPENIIINRFNNNQVALIDFSEVVLAPVYYDIASFLQQLEFMTLNYLDRQEFSQIEYVFCSTYFNRKKLPKEITNKLNLYKAWTALKSTIYFMIFEDETNRNFARHLLTQSEDFYRQIK